MSDATYIVHENPVRRLASNHIALADLEPYGFPGQFEQLWFEPGDDGEFRVACLPFRVYGLALGDDVELDEERRIVARLLRRSGHRVLRVFLAKELEHDEFVRLRVRLVNAIAEVGAAAEWSGDRHVAIDILPDQPVGFVEEVIGSYLSVGFVLWEWADAEPFRAVGKPANTDSRST